MGHMTEIMWKNHSSGPKPVVIDSSVTKKKRILRSKNSHRNMLEYANAELFSQVINETVNELDLMAKYFAKFIDNIRDEIFGYRTLAERFGQITDEHYREFRINIQYGDHHHLMKQARTVTRLLSQLYREMKAKNTFSTILHYLRDSNMMKKDEENVLTKFESNTKYFNSLILRFRDEKLEFILMGCRYNYFVQETKQAIENEYWQKLYEVKYLQKWEDSRCEQHDIKLDGNNNIVNSIIQTHKIEVERENICYSDVSKFLNEMDNVYKNDIQNWMEIYEVDMETYENNIFKLKVDLEKLTDDKQIMQETYERRQREIDEWLEYKRLKKELEERIKLECWAATKIQAWWRGTMVRKKLGPYRKKRKNQKGKKNLRQLKSKKGLRRRKL